MFQFKNGSDSNEPSLANKLPNFHGKVRTFKEDLGNFEKGTPNQSSVEKEDFSSPPPSPVAKKNISPVQQAMIGKDFGQPNQTYQKNENPVENPFQPMPTPAPTSSPDPDLSALKPSSSQSFFSENPPAPENIFPPQVEKGNLPQKPKKMIFVFLIILLVAMAAAAGFYYYWFYVKSAAPAISTTPEVPAPEAKLSSAASVDTSTAETSQEGNLRKMVVDTTQGEAAIKSAISTFSTDFVSTASEGDLIEVKTIDQASQPIGKKDFFSGLGITIPDTIVMKLSEDYSLFVKKEMGVAKLGLVFKTVTSANLADEMKNWEPTMASDMNSIFVGQTPTGAKPFNSSRYKNADIRYSNFSSPPDTSLDYSVIANFLVIGTSKDTNRSILDYMSEK